MSDAPERIMAIKLQGAKSATFLGGDTSEPFDATEYVRADLHEALRARAEAAEARVALMDATIRAALEKRDRDGMKPGWGVEREWLRAALRNGKNGK